MKSIRQLKIENLQRDKIDSKSLRDMIMVNVIFLPLIIVVEFDGWLRKKFQPITQPFTQPLVQCLHKASRACHEMWPRVIPDSMAGDLLLYACLIALGLAAASY